MFLPWSGTIFFTGKPTADTVESAADDLNVAVIPLDSSPNQSFTVSLYIDGVNRTFRYSISYNEMAGYWVMKVIDPSSGSILLDNVPLLTCPYPYANMLSQFKYLRIGSAYVYKAGKTSHDYPDDSTIDLGTNFLLVWGDTNNG